MFDLEKFYKNCESGEKVDAEGINQYILSFETVIIWGSAGLGKAIGTYLEKIGVKHLVYWDLRYCEIEVEHQRKIEAPFSEEYDREKTLLIYSIPNHVIMDNLIAQVKQEGYINYIRGDIFYSGILCPYCLGTKPSAKQCWMKNECRSVICKRLQNIVNSNIGEQKPGERIDITYNCFIINSMCNLSCTHCVQFINNYPLEKRGNIPTDIICRDIDLWLNMIDSVGTISVMGGETFMHPDIVRIANQFAKHDNFGFVSFPTNGLFPIKPEQLDGIKDDRVIIAFGAYQHVATEEQMEIYYKNVELVKSYGIAYTESRHLPTWIVPGGIYYRTTDEEYMTKKKQACPTPPRNVQIRDGKIHVCDKGVALYAMGVADYPEDYYVLTQEGSLEERREQFRQFSDKPFYYTCGHCSEKSEAAPSALQGKIDVFSASSYDNVDWFKLEKK